jgi:hypothetical protein
MTNIRILKCIIVAAAIMLQCDARSYALSNNVIEAQRSRAEGISAMGNVDGAIKIYHDLIAQGVFNVADALSRLYNDHKSDYAKAGLWCYVAIETKSSENFKCENYSFSTILSQAELKNLRRLAIQCIATSYKHCDQLEAGFEKELTQFYSKYCTVADPKDKTFNIREQPNGKIITQYKNGAEVIHEQTALDKNGRKWMLVADDLYAITIGWVLGDFVKCNTRKRL